MLQPRLSRSDSGVCGVWSILGFPVFVYDFGTLRKTTRPKIDRGLFLDLCSKYDSLKQARPVDTLAQDDTALSVSVPYYVQRCNGAAEIKECLLSHHTNRTASFR